MSQNSGCKILTEGILLTLDPLGQKITEAIAVCEPHGDVTVVARNVLNVAHTALNMKLNGQIDIDLQQLIIRMLNE